MHQINTYPLQPAHLLTNPLAAKNGGGNETRKVFRASGRGYASETSTKIGVGVCNAEIFSII